MANIHSLLSRQLKKYLGDSSSVPKELQAIFDAINNAYIQSDIDRNMLERSLDLSSQELLIANAELKKTLSLLNATIESTRDGVLVVDLTGEITSFNKNFTDMWHIPSDIVDSLDDARTLRFVSDQLQDPDGFIKKVEELYAQPDAESFDALKFKDGRIFERYSRPQKIEEKSVGRVWSFRDITIRKRAEEQIARMAYFDVLTELPNRCLFEDLLRKELAKARRSKRCLAVLFVDVDRFKVINDTLGHSVGDELLKAIAKRLRDLLRESDILCRFGGDEFIILIPEVTDVKSIGVIAGKINQALSRAFMLGNNELYVTASVGISFFPANGLDIEMLIKNADCAMYQAKKQGRNTYQFYDSNTDAGALEKLSLETSLRKALRQKEFLLYYQPQIDLHLGRIVGAEALLRWKNNSGSISTKQLISLAEETDLIIPLGEWILRTACEQQVMWQEKGAPPIRMAINVSMIQFRHNNFVSTLSKIIEETGANPNKLELELTESIIMHDIDYTMAVMGELKSLGIELSIDDFGTGYSSLSYLKHLPLDKLKIDQSFVRALTTSANDYAICKAIIVMAHSLDLRVVAEGVETNGQLAFLRTLHCNEAQGFFLGRPLPEEELLHLMLTRDNDRTIQALSPQQNNFLGTNVKNVDSASAFADLDKKLSDLLMPPL